MNVELKIPDKLLPLANPKRFKIIIGGRGGGKSESVATMLASVAYDYGCRIVCGREYQSSIKQSVHSLMSRKIKEMELPGADILETKIEMETGGEIIYQGLARDPQAIKSVDEAKIFWLEEGQSVSQESLDELTPSIRADYSEVWITANLGSSTDPFSKRFIKPFEKALRANGGYYEDDLHIIIWINYYDNPWFPDTLEAERQHDERTMTAAGYAHKWLGEFSDTVENAIVLPEWFDAAVDAHKKLNFPARGIEVVTHDPSDNGADAKGVCYRHGVVITECDEMDFGDINAGGDWAADLALARKPDVFLWDGDGMGVGLRRQFNQAFDGKRISLQMFRGAGSPDRPHMYYETGAAVGDQKTNAQTFLNKRAQYWINLRDRFHRTYRAVTKGEYIDPDELISISSTIPKLDLLRAEICSVPLVPNMSGLIRVMSKKEMATHGIGSPNMADCVMMSFSATAQRQYDDHEESDSGSWMS